MADIEKVIKGLECCTTGWCRKCPYFDEECCLSDFLQRDALAMLKEQEARIQKYEYVFDFLGIGFRQWATKIIDGEAEAICEVDEHKRETVIRFKYI